MPLKNPPYGKILTSQFGGKFQVVVSGRDDMYTVKMLERPTDSKCTLDNLYGNGCWLNIRSWNNKHIDSNIFMVEPDAESVQVRDLQAELDTANEIIETLEDLLEKVTRNWKAAENRAEMLSNACKLYETLSKMQQRKDELTQQWPRKPYEHRPPIDRWYSPDFQPQTVPLTQPFMMPTITCDTQADLVAMFGGVTDAFAAR